jgi:hypothetical protein
VTPGSPLARAGGWLVVQCVNPEFVPLLADESCRASTDSVEDRRMAAAATPRADPDRWLLRAPGGEALDLLYQSSGLVEVLTTLTGTAWVRTGDHASYSYYCRPGHYLGRHLDAEDCGLAVITCLRDERPDRATEGGILRLHTDPVTDVRLSAGDTVVLLGGELSHEVLPLDAGQIRVVAALCFRPEDHHGGPALA